MVSARYKCVKRGWAHGGFDSSFDFIRGVFGIILTIFRPQATHFAMCVGWLSAYVATFQRIRLNIQLCVILDFVVSFYGAIREAVWSESTNRVRNGPLSAAAGIRRVFHG